MRSWEIPIGRIYRRVEERGRDDLPLLSVYRELGVVPREGREDNFNRPSDDLSSYKVVRPGDLVLNKMKTWQGSLGVSSHSGIVSPAYFVGRQDAEVHGPFMHHLLRSQPLVNQYAARSKGIRPSQWDLPWEEFASIRVRLPRLAEQRAIADYLDTETARIDALITKKRRMIDLLSERARLAGEEKIQRLRESTRQVPLKYLVRESDERLGSGAVPTVLSVSIHHGVVPRDVVSDRPSRADDFENYKTCRPGDIAINRMRAFQGGVGVVREAGVVSPDYTVLHLGANLNAEYLHFVMRSFWFVGEMSMRLRGIGSADQGQVRTPRINFADLGLIPIPVPAARVQDEVAVSSIRMEREADALTTRLTAQADLLAEHRQALITAAVTGELDVSKAS